MLLLNYFGVTMFALQYVICLCNHLTITDQCCNGVGRILLLSNEQPQNFVDLKKKTKLLLILDHLSSAPERGPLKVE